MQVCCVSVELKKEMNMINIMAFEVTNVNFVDKDKEEMFFVVVSFLLNELKLWILNIVALVRCLSLSSLHFLLYCLFFEYSIWFGFVVFLLIWYSLFTIVCHLQKTPIWAVQAFPVFIFFNFFFYAFVFFALCIPYALAS